MRGAPAADHGDAPHLADPRALTILTTEHWSLLTARSLVYNESFSRGAMFLTFLSASLVALGFLYQANSPDFAFVLIAILGLDLFVGLATLGRLASASNEELAALQAMNRIRHAYLEMVPSLDPYFSTSRYDDAVSVLSAYGPTTNQGMLMNVLHGLTTMPGMIGLLDAALAGAVAASIAAAAGADMRVALLAGLVVGLGVTLALVAYSIRVFGSVATAFTTRFPAPDPAGTDEQPSGHRDR
jgi:hypothetical protein